MNWFIVLIWEAIQDLWQIFSDPHVINPINLPMNQPSIIPTTAPDPDALIPDWSIHANARHNVRALADLCGLSEVQKNLMSQVLHCESNYNVNCVHPNIVNGKVMSTDYGICQWNDYYHGKEISPEDALHNPEKAVRLMCEYVKAGRISQWVCYSRGLYEAYSA